MILVTVGTHCFDALITEIDRLAGLGVFKDDVIAQIGRSKLAPVHIQYTKYMKDLVDQARRASMIITHAGTGSLLEFLPLEKPMIIVANPALADHHQREFLEALERQYGVSWIDGPLRLEESLAHIEPIRWKRSSCDLAADIGQFILSR